MFDSEGITKVDKRKTKESNNGGRADYDVEKRGKRNAVMVLNRLFLDKKSIFNKNIVYLQFGIIAYY